MSANARAASRRRWSSVKPPSRSAAMISGYASDVVTTATLAWFLAAARTMAGPPMSICSTQASTSGPEATVSRNGYRLLTSRSNGSTPSAPSCSTCAGRRMSASRPACTLGCSVFTRPSRHSGNPVRSSTRVTAIPSPAIRAAVEPVDTISTSASASARASSSRPLLSYTLTSARRMGRRSSLMRPLRSAPWPHEARRAEPADSLADARSWDRDLPSGDGPTFAHHAPDVLHQLAALGDLDALGQGLLGVVVEYGYRHLGDDRPAVHAAVGEVQRRAGELHAVGEGVAGSVHAGERRQQRVVGVDVPAGVLGQERRPDQFQEAGRDHEVGGVSGTRGRQGLVPVVAAGEVRY